MWILSLFGWLAGAMGTLMGATLYYTVVRMGTMVGAFTSIQVAWGVFRDIGNIALIFGFMAIGIATILDNATYGAKKALASLLIVAITLNFSLFVAEFIVDTGNLFATQFYAQMYGSAGMPQSFDVSTEPVTNHLMTNLGLTTLYNFQNGEATQAAQAGSAAQGHWFFTFFAGMLLFAITALVFGAIAIMLIARFVILLFLFIVSPIGFLGLADIPMVKEYGKKWWKALTDQTIFAPVMMLLLLVVVKVGSEPQLFALSGATTDAASVFTSAGAGQVANLLLSFAIIIGLLIASLIIAKSLSSQAAGFATKWSGRVVNSAVNLGIGGSARVLRKASSLTGDNKFSRAVNQTMRPIERTNFDFRRLPGMKAAGAPEDLSYRKISTKARDFVGAGEGKTLLKKIGEENRREMDTEKRLAQRKENKKAVEDFARQIADLDAQLAAGTITQANYDAQMPGLKNNLSKMINGMSTKDLSELKGIREGVSTLATNLSPEKFEALMKGTELLDSQKGELGKKRYQTATGAVEALTKAKTDFDAVRNNPATPPGTPAYTAAEQAYKNARGNAQKAVRGLAKKDVENAPAALHASEAFLKSLADKQADDLGASGKVNPAIIRDARGKRFDTKVDTEDVINSMKSADIAKLPDNILTKRDTLEALSYQQIRGLLDNPNNLSNNVQAALATYVNDVMINPIPATPAQTQLQQQLITLRVSDPTLVARWGL